MFAKGYVSVLHTAQAGNLEAINVPFKTLCKPFVTFFGTDRLYKQRRSSIRNTIWNGVALFLAQLSQNLRFENGVFASLLRISTSAY